MLHMSMDEILEAVEVAARSRRKLEQHEARLHLRAFGFPHLRLAEAAVVALSDAGCQRSGEPVRVCADDLLRPVWDDPAWFHRVACRRPRLLINLLVMRGTV
jgi:hypothetical protein